MLRPTLPLPDHLRGNETGTFTEDSVVRRLPEIARRTLDDNELNDHRRECVERLAEEIGSGVITAVDEPEAIDAAAWRNHVAPHVGLSWVDAPWFFVETYFYRRLLSATGYSQPGARKGVDPFALQKRTGFNGAADLAGRLGDNLDDGRVLLAAALWANRVDLSLWRAGEGDVDERTAAVMGDGTSRLLVDDGERVLGILERGGGNVHLVLDNAGAELVADLALAAFVLDRGGHVTFHAKPHPTFVSDVTLPDLAETIQGLRRQDTPAAQIGDKLLAAGERGSLVETSHPFWVSPLPFWDCPNDLVDELASADLVVVKGDANYRRLLGDLHWAPTTPFPSIVRPRQPLVALRTPKSLVAAGIDQQTIDRAAAADPNWMTNGEWGMIQFADRVT
ncbi:MAG: damage-control phosphatase ARMT1 family protein [Acidimicrobiia bacterium]|nr:damage-control phosphatase ARMT1 family protein [Acidimicrobiia bacterium]